MNILFMNTEIEKPLLETPQKPVEKPPIENIITLLEQVARMKMKRKPLLEKMNLLTDSDYVDLKQIEEMEKIEEEVDFISKYMQNLENQAVVIMNEHNVKNIPLLEDVEKRLLLEVKDHKLLLENDNKF